ncbi:ABC transporter permease [Oscillatoria sp. FACHB-1407]|uniref:ABC transporter permease n=1 Tax=Oscillatoria sp. FACHB-1407 TaxID=2692847 RepID=UPI00168759E7|nr:ABC transporter permease [Oscillatoria sp. FACHB-1407]MBD2463710.1 ABC transporter permease [Oscillatoria sp. FACHB-1407]
MDFWNQFKRDRLAVIGAVIVAIFVIVSIAAPVIAPYSPTEQFVEGLSLQGSPLPPSSQFWLGTDLLGRDLFTRLLYGARVSLLVGVVANAIAVLLGITLGAIAGFVRGFVGEAIMRFTDLMMAFPALLLAIALAAILRPSLWIVAMVIALVNWVQIARVVYSQVSVLVEQEHIQAARSLGATRFQILWWHIVPHLIPTALVWGTLGISTTVLQEATLSFLGVGVQPPTPSWGGIINESQSFLQSAPWLIIFPGISILIVSLAFNLVGDGVRDAVDPTERGR